MPAAAVYRSLSLLRAVFQRVREFLPVDRQGRKAVAGIYSHCIRAPSLEQVLAESGLGAGGVHIDKKLSMLAAPGTGLGAGGRSGGALVRGEVPELG